MSNDVLKGFSTRATPQTRPTDRRQSKNNAGGQSFTVTPEQRLRRFLILGTSAGTYYVTAKSLTLDNAKVVVEMANSDHKLLRDTIHDVSVNGKAPKQDATLFALAIAASHGSDEDKRAALDMLSQIARTGTHLFQFVDYVQQFRGWGRGLVRGLSNWYLDKPADKMAFQAVKYRNRNSWTHRDVLRKAHPLAVDPATRATFDWITHNAVGDATPKIIEGFLKAQEPGADVPKVLAEYGLTWEMLPTESLTDPKVWQALLDKGMPMMALMRNLPRLTSLGLLQGTNLTKVTKQFKNAEYVRKSRLHPLAILNAHVTYAEGRGRGSSTWTPNAKIIDALDEAFYLAFENVEPAGVRMLNGLDVSGSMLSLIQGSVLSARAASVALALVQTATEPDVTNIAFTSQGGYGYRPRASLPGFWQPKGVATSRFTFTGSGVSELSISPRQRLRDAIRDTSDLPFGGTDCALPMLYALDKGLEVDVFTVYTDSETWAGDIHPHQALTRYREQTGIDAKLVVVGMTSTGFTIAPPNDPNFLDVVGFDTATPSLISQFAKGEL